MWPSISSRGGVWRVAALALLLCAAFDLAAVDTVWPRANSLDSCCGSASDADCFCCCAHIVVVDPAVFRPLMTVTAFEQLRDPHVESVPPSVPYRPPLA